MCFLCSPDQAHASHIAYEQQAMDVSRQATVSSSSASYINTLIDGKSWTGNTGQAANVGYSFGVTFEGGTLFNANERAGATAAMQAWSNVANITFSSVSTSSAVMAFSSTNFGADLAGLTSTFYTGSQLEQAEVQIDTTVNSFTPGGFDYLVMLHEVGHALGLKHPGNYGSSDNGPYLSSTEDQVGLTVMSYNDGALVDNINNAPMTPMIYDVAAIQYLYGANTSYNSGDSIYTFTGTQVATTIWDGGGSDLINTSSYGSGSIIDLNAGSGNITRVGSTVAWVAFGANIENAFGGAGADLITGNTLSNALYGYGGSDTILGGTGGDVLFGGNAVTDPLDASDLILGGSGQDTIYGNGGNDSIYGGNGSTDSTDGSDLIYGGNGSDQLFGNAGNDVIFGGGSPTDAADVADTIYGGNGSDQLSANGGNDLIFGGGSINDATDAADTIWGGIGNDTIYANGGNDLIYDGAGNDSLNGGAGNDYFIFAANSGVDVIMAFDNAGATAGDIFAVSGTSFSSASQLLAAVTYSSGNAVVDLGSGNSVTIIGVASGLTVDDFAIV